MAEIATTGTVLTEEDVKERVDVGIAFLVLLFMGGLGAYLMTNSDSDLPALDLTAVPVAGVAGSMPSAVGSSVENAGQVSAFEPRSRERSVVQAPVEAVSLQSAQPAVSDVEVGAATVVSQPGGETTQEVSEPMFQPVLERPVESVVEPVVEPVAEQIIEPVVEKAPAAAELPVETTVSEEESALLKLATDSVSFVTGSAVLTEQSTEVLDDIGALLRARPDSRLSVIGYTDSQGDPDENVALSFARAEACRDYLLDHGAKVGQVDSAGMGSRKPVGDNATPEGRRANRRVEFRLLKGS